MIHSVAAEPSAPLVSVVIPSYNAQATLSHAIASVLSQTLADLELIVVDDGSRDGSAVMAKALAERDPRITVVEQANAGPSAARNRGMQIARGQYIGFLDADDLWHCDHLARHVYVLDRNTDVGVSFSPCDIMNESGQLTGEHTKAWPGDVAAEEFLGGNPTATCSSLVVRKDVIADVGLFTPDMSFAEDQDWLFRIARSHWRIRGIADRSVCYRTSPSGLSSNSERMLSGWTTFIANARRVAPDLVAKHIAHATCQIHLYHARRAIRTRQPNHVAYRYLSAAISADKSSLLNQPIYLAGLATAALSPCLTEAAIKAIKRLRYV